MYFWKYSQQLDNPKIAFVEMEMVVKLGCVRLGVSVSTCIEVKQ